MAPVQNQDYSLLHVERISQYVSLSPASLATPLPALCASIFSPLLLSYFPPAKGIVLAYEDVELSDEPPRTTSTTKSSSRKKTARREEESSSDNSDSEDQGPGKPLLLRHVDEYSSPFLWATASFLIWRPQSQAHIPARITHQSSTHITLSHLNTFPVSVLANQLPTDWEFVAAEQNKKKKGWDDRVVDEGGWWVDGEGNRVGEEEVSVRIRDFDGRMDGRGKGKGFLRIEGSLVSLEEEERREGVGRGRKGKQRVSGRAQGEVMEVD